MQVMFKDQNAVDRIKGIIFDIKRFAIHDGRGIRTTVFFKGCPLNCRWCHNPESREKGIEENGAKETPGEKVSVKQVMTEIEKDTLFYDESSGGVTFSGGEPLMQLHFLKALLTESKEKEIHTILDTCGYASPKTFDSIIDNVDLFYYDLKLMDENRHLKYTGVSNRQIKKNLKTLSLKRKNVVIRFPIIPGITDDRENITEMIAFISALKGIEEIDLLPYHKTAAEKYKRFGMEYQLISLNPPTKNRMEVLKHNFEKYGFKVKIGG
jgi:pyruvate formate lyase activating enzyme